MIRKSRGGLPPITVPPKDRRSPACPPCGASSFSSASAEAGFKTGARGRTSTWPKGALSDFADLTIGERQVKPRASIACALRKQVVLLREECFRAQGCVLVRELHRGMGVIRSNRQHKALPAPPSVRLHELRSPGAHLPGFLLFDLSC